MTDIVVVGGGAAGLMAAGQAASFGKSVAVLERNDRLGRKLLITGKGRCNVTNNSGLTELIASVPRNGKFLYSAFSSFSAQDAMEFFEENGLLLKTERGNRVFPQSDRAVDVAGCLTRFAKAQGVRFVTGRADRLLTEGGRVCGVGYDKTQQLHCGSVILATGGMSYPRTGSTGDGYRLAQTVGHTVAPPTASLVPIVVKEPWCRDMQGLSLKNVTLTVTETESGKQVFSQMGEMLFTHFGVSGPLVLSASAHMRGIHPGKYRLTIDLKPALSGEQLDARLLRDIQANANKDFVNILRGLLPAKMLGTAAKLSGIPFETKGNQITREMRARLCALLKGMTMTAEGFRPVDEAIITSGGVNVAEVSPKTMESKILPGLFFAGELLDVDAYTGGYNLQIAWSTGYLAGLNA